MIELSIEFERGGDTFLVDGQLGPTAKFDLSRAWILLDNEPRPFSIDDFTLEDRKAIQEIVNWLVYEAEFAGKNVGG